jgi:hypothetical protein
LAFDKKDVAAFADYKEEGTAAPQKEEPKQQAATQPPPKQASVSTSNLPEHEKVTMPALSPTMSQVLKAN